MRPGFVAVVVGFLLTGFIAFFGGEWWARYDAERNCIAAASHISASQHAQVLFIVRQVLKNLRSGRSKEADALLVRYAKLQVPQLTECAKSAQCVFWAGKFMPSEAELSEVASMKELP